MSDEAEAYDALRRLSLELAPYVRELWCKGDGRGGAILYELATAAGIDYFAAPEASPRRKAVISRALAKSVFERDAYRCVACGTHVDLTCDHVIAESRGGATTLANLQTMCRSCNCRKGVS